MVDPQWSHDGPLEQVIIMNHHEPVTGCHMSQCLDSLDLHSTRQQICDLHNLSLFKSASFRVKNASAAAPLAQHFSKVHNLLREPAANSCLGPAQR